MLSYSEYYRQRLLAQTARLTEVYKYRPKIYYITTCKKRKYEEAMGYPIDSDDERIREELNISKEQN
jgi:hypothetical protein